ncbi:hypothetical protein T4C_1861 [Trichinella pseudospiralis]|uniref:Uncharacterized protein n=1 Tax=Trichinella pseudospiralis TaxID=6337 RepID=A0A0V1IIH6_TRIPS|nr:hypothetical protein T4C_1861 [Trichinella pseudospiralis]
MTRSVCRYDMLALHSSPRYESFAVLLAVTMTNGLHQRIGVGLESQRYCCVACAPHLLIKIRIAPEHPTLICEKELERRKSFMMMDYVNIIDNLRSYC